MSWVWSLTSRSRYKCLGHITGPTHWSQFHFLLISFFSYWTLALILNFCPGRACLVYARNLTDFCSVYSWILTPERSVSTMHTAVTANAWWKSFVTAATRWTWHVSAYRPRLLTEFTEKTLQAITLKTCLQLCRCALWSELISSNEPGDSLQWLCHDDNTINTVTSVII